MWTPSERRGALVLIALLALGTGWDLWRAAHPEWRSLPGAPPDTAASPRPARAPSDAPGAPRTGHGKPLPAGPIDLNHAGADEIHALPGIGPVLARRIVDYRAAHGAFRSAEDLLAVRGIGPRLLERIRPYIRV